MQRPIAVLFVITRLAVGGAPQSLLTAIRGLMSRGYRIALATGYPGPEEGSMVEQARALGVEIHFVPALQRDLHPLRDMRAFFHLLSIVKHAQVDVVHTHLSKAGILGRLAAHLSGVPAIVHTYHGDVLDGYFSPLKSRAFLWAERMAGRVTHRFICVSEALKTRFLDYHLGPAGAFCAIPNGIDIDAFGNVPRPTHAGFCVGTLAMFYPIKRLDLFVEMAFHIRQRRKDVRFVIAGGGREEQALHALAQARGAPVEFLGICENPLSFFADLDAFVLCSDYEGAGMSVMEAMAAGVPVVATRVGGVPEMVRDGQTGLLVNPGNADVLAHAVCALLDNADLRRTMGQQARACAQAHFSHKKMVDALDALYRAQVRP